MSILGDVYTVDNTLTGNPSITDLDSLSVNELTANFINTVAGSKILNLANSTSDLQDQIDALIVGVGTAYYGAWYDTTTQTNANTSTGNLITFNSEDSAIGIEQDSTDKSKFTFLHAGTYSINFSLQVVKTDSGTDYFDAFILLNGVKLDNSRGQQRMSGNNDAIITGWSFFYTAAVNDYIQLKWYSTDAQMELQTLSATSVVPLSPSAAININQLTALDIAPAPVISIGTTTTLASGSSATVTDTGTAENPIFNFGIPQGIAGNAGVTPNVTVGSTSTLSAGSSATVTRTGTTANPIFSFGIPQGIAGITPNVTVGSTTTLSAGSNALVVRTGTDANPVFSFSIPQGSQGIQGIAGITWKGIWSSATLYAIGDAVSYFGTSFICISPAQGDGQSPVLSFFPPTNGNGYWQVLSDKGSQGQQGNKGDQGDEGDKGNTGDKGDKGDTGPAGGLDPLSAATLAAVVLDAAVVTAKTINIAIPPATILGLTTFGGATIFTGAVTVGTPLTPAPFTAVGVTAITGATTITGETTINGPVTMSATLTVAAGISGIQVSTNYLYPLTGDTIQLTGVLEVLGSVNPYTVNTRNLIVKNNTETYNILEINPTTRVSTWKDGAGVNRFIIGTRPEVGGTEADNYFTCIADNIILGDITNTTAITINAPTVTIGNEGTLLLIGNICEDIFIGNNSFGEVTFGTVVVGFRSDNVEIGNNAVVIDIGAESTDLSIGLEATNVSLGTDAETINIGLHEIAAISSTINIGKNETTSATPNTINIGTGTAYSNINIGSATDANSYTTINGAVEFTGEVAFQAGGGPLVLPDFINQMVGRIL